MARKPHKSKLTGPADHHASEGRKALVDAERSVDKSLAAEDCESRQEHLHHALDRFGAAKAHLTEDDVPESAREGLGKVTRKLVTARDRVTSKCSVG